MARELLGTLLPPPVEGRIPGTEIRIARQGALIEGLEDTDEGDGGGSVLVGNEDGQDREHDSNTLLNSDQAENKNGREHDANGGPHPSGGKKSKSRRRRNKTEFQQEYNRISQRERRENKRNKNRQEREAKEGVGIYDDDVAGFSMLWVMYLAHEQDGQFRKEIPKPISEAMHRTKSQQAVEEYIGQHNQDKGARLSDVNDIADDVAFQQRKLAALRRQHMVIDKTTDYYRRRVKALEERLFDSLEEQSGSLQLIQAKILEEEEKLEAVRHAAVLLPTLIDEVNKHLDYITGEGQEMHEWIMLLQQIRMCPKREIQLGVARSTVKRAMESPRW